MPLWAKVARDLPFASLLNTDTVSRVLQCSFGPSRTSLYNYDNINGTLEDLHAQLTARIKTRNESLSDKKQYVCGHCEWQICSNKFRYFVFLFLLSILLNNYKFKNSNNNNNNNNSNVDDDDNNNSKNLRILASFTRQL
jgi:hypothetical protein